MATLLVITAFLPLAGSLALFLSPRMPVARARMVALGTVLATLVPTFILLFAFRTGVVEPQFAFGGRGGPYGVSWLEEPNIRFAFGLDGLSIWLFVLTAVLMLPAVFSSWE